MVTNDILSFFPSLPFSHLILFHLQAGSKRDKKAANHGYDNDLLSMRPLFMASGPGFKKNYTFEDPIEMINLYSLFCHLLQVQPSSTNEGSVKEVAHILSSKSSSTGNDHVGNDHVGNDHVGNDHVGNDHVGNDHVGDDRVGNDHVGNDDTTDSSSKTNTNSTETGEFLRVDKFSRRKMRLFVI